MYNQFTNSNNLHYELIFSYVSFCPKTILCGMTYIGGEEKKEKRNKQGDWTI